MKMNAIEYTAAKANGSPIVKANRILPNESGTRRRQGWWLELTAPHQMKIG